ncbi:ileal sodium/bile acid cotransporter-like [Anneissia japonica]|uniref:ileal sodium/bile acid cotransporter-like n=1 Tax=Anneissia japonica TaxID=1529436 RepID=UPI00142587A5|nr:ileal sodium/bile acid cotransporter-like [Anneissia japonica]
MTAPPVTYTFGENASSIVWSTPNIKSTGYSAVDTLQLANRVILTVLLVFIMLAVGSVVTLNDFKVTLKRPTGIAIGFVCQFGIMPLVAFSLAHILKVDAAHALGMLIIGCSPGGVTSQIYTFWSKGDICLSICMTTVSTLSAMGMMPLCLWIYGRSWTDESVVIPYTNITISMVLILVPVIIGMIIRHYKEEWARRITLVGSFTAILALSISMVLGGLSNPSMFKVPWTVWFAASVMSPIAFLLGYIIAYLLRQSQKKCRTIAFETGCQNAALALTIIAISFAGSEDYFDLMAFPSLFGTFLIIDSCVTVLILKLIGRKRKESGVTAENSLRQTSSVGKIPVKE